MKAKGKEIMVECFRFSPGEDCEPRFQTYEVPFVADSSVLNVLEYIYENLDTSLAYYASCRRGVCGRCHIRVNGRACLACGTKVTGNLKLEPVKRNKVIRDLKMDDLPEADKQAR